MKSVKIIYATAILLTCFTFIASAQGSGGPPQGGNTGAPVDSGAIALLVGAAAYGYSQLKKKEVTAEKQ